ncbi:MAG: ABC transporter permease [Candidatus Thermoplasmatota archaeon]|nr:ABC transporter permease [Candidatus Thermoplasmatota archaeon]
MSALGNIIRKEMKELLTPATILPIVVVALIFGSMGGVIQGIQEEALEPPVIGFINADGGNFSTSASTIITTYADVVFNATDIAEKQSGLDTIKQKDGVALIIIPANFSEDIQQGKQGTIEIYWIMQGAGLMDAISSDVLEQLIRTINNNISRELIQGNTTANATLMLNPTMRNEVTYFKDVELPGLTPGIIVGLLSQQSMLIPIVMMMIIIMAGSMVISSMAMEKENKTLETLLTLPVKRTSIVTGKIVASAVIGLMLAVIYMIGMSYYFQGLGMSGGVNLAEYGLVLTSQDFILVGISLFITLIAGLSLCMLLGTFAKNYKSAQTLTFPITMFAMIPMFITMFADFDTLPLAVKGFLFAIPFSHPMMAPRALMFNDYLLVFGGIAYVTIFAIVTIAIVVWVFKTDRLLTGSIKKKQTKGVKSLFMKRR